MKPERYPCIECGADVVQQKRGRLLRRCDPCKRAIRIRLSKEWASRTRVYRCACGRPIGRIAKVCRQCRSPARHCEWCGGAFRRYISKKWPTHDAGRFCSKRCSGARRRAETAEREAPRLAAAAITRAQNNAVRAALKAAHAICPCGQPVAGPSSRWCGVCYGHRIGNGIRAAYVRSTLSGLEHICPNCGDTFKGYAQRLCCSRACSIPYGRKQREGTYPPIRSMPLEERNKVAWLISLVRRANQIMWSRTDKEGRMIAPAVDMGGSLRMLGGSERRAGSKC